MLLSTNGIVTNEWGHVLLIRRDDTRTFAPPGGGLEAGELPTENVAREVQEETGLRVLPVRLVGLYHFAWGKTGGLCFNFRCLQRGGQLTTSAESPQVGFFAPDNLPRPMAPLHRERLQRDLFHAGGSPYWGSQKMGLGSRVGKFLLRQGVYRWRDWQRRRRGEPLYTPPPDWQLSAWTIVQNERGEVLWGRMADETWQLPGGAGLPTELPWVTAVRSPHRPTGLTLQLTGLTAVYATKAHAPHGLCFQSANGKRPVDAGLGMVHSRRRTTRRLSAACRLPRQRLQFARRGAV
jgi:ADP-ribose pyrophosphatase YjhB (NUDIX family)